MPKPIKKRPVKAGQQKEDVQEVLSRIAEQAGERKKQLAMAGIALLVVVLVSAGAYLFNKNANQRALLLESDAYMLFKGNYGTESERTEGLEKALADFRDANATRPTAFRKYYIAETLFELGRYEDCLKALDEFDAEYSSNMRFLPVARLKRAMVQRRMGNSEAALATLQEFNFISSRNLKDYAIIETAELLETMGRDNDAQQYYSQILREYPESRFIQLAQSRVKQPEPSKAMQQEEGAGIETGQKPLSIDLK